MQKRKKKISRRPALCDYSHTHRALFVAKHRQTSSLAHQRTLLSNVDFIQRTTDEKLQNPVDRIETQCKRPKNQNTQGRAARGEKKEGGIPLYGPSMMRHSTPFACPSFCSQRCNQMFQTEQTLPWGPSQPVNAASNKIKRQGQVSPRAVGQRYERLDEWVKGGRGINGDRDADENDKSEKRINLSARLSQPRLSIEQHDGTGWHPHLRQNVFQVEHEPARSRYNDLA